MLDEGSDRSKYVRHLEGRVDQLQHALDSRVIIEQAKGVLAERHGLAMHKAFEILRGHARNNGRNIHEIAEEVVSGELDIAVS